MNAKDSARLEKIVGNDVPSFVAVTPSADLDATIRRSEELITAVCAEDVVSFEMHGEGRRVTFGVRGKDVSGIRRQLESHYPQAGLSIPRVDPIEVRAGEAVHTAILKVEGPEQLPLRTFSDDQTYREGTSPLLGILAELGGLPAEVRVLVRALASPMAHDWAEAYKRDALSGAGGSNVETRDHQRDQERTDGSSNTSLWPIFALLAIIVVLFLYMKFQDELSAAFAFVGGLSDIQFLLLAALFGVILAVLALAVNWLIGKVPGIKKTQEIYHDPVLVEQRIYDPAYHFEIQVIVFTKDGGSVVKSRAPTLMSHILSQYRRFDHAQGSKVVLHDKFSNMSKDVMNFNFRRRGLGLGRARVGSMVGLRELAGLWHLPSAQSNPHFVTKTRLKRLPLTPGILDAGAPVGITTAGERRLVRLDEEDLSRHVFLSGGSGSGKSTAITHILGNAMRRMADGVDDTGIVVIDPHAALIDDLLSLVPVQIAHRVRLIDLADPSHVPGVNLLSPRVSPSRDVAAECLVKIASSQWDNFGSRMDEILRYSVRTLYEANSHESIAPESAFTLLDITRLFNDRDFRQRVVTLVEDRDIEEWWDTSFGTYLSGDRSLTIGPIANRLSAFRGAETSRVILGQPFSTIDLRESIRAGDIVLVNTASGKVGDDVAFLLGSYIFMMVDEIVRSRPENSTEHPHTIVVVDEAQTLAGVDFGKSLREWRKYRASLLLATQTLGSLRARSADLVDSILANAGLLAVFNVSDADAKVLAPNLGHGSITHEDVSEQPDFHCYGRLKKVGAEAVTFSMRLLPPMKGRPAAVREEIRRRYARYSQNREVIWHRLQARGDHPFDY